MAQALLQECYDSVSLPAGSDKEKDDNKYHNGVLTVTTPKTAENKAKKVRSRQLKCNFILAAVARERLQPQEVPNCCKYKE